MSDNDLIGNPWVNPEPSGQPNPAWKIPGWLKAILIGVLLIGLFVAAMIGVVLFSFANSDAYQASKRYLESNQQVQQITGGITGYGLFPTGSFHLENGAGDARLIVEVSGKKQDASVYFKMRKEPNHPWEVQQAIVKKAGELTGNSRPNLDDFEEFD